MAAMAKQTKTYMLDVDVANGVTRCAEMERLSASAWANRVLWSAVEKQLSGVQLSLTEENPLPSSSKKKPRTKKK